MEGSPSDLSTSNMKARCEICVKEFANLRTMKRHFTLLHKTHNYQCDICRKVAKKRNQNVKLVVKSYQINILCYHTLPQSMIK